MDVWRSEKHIALADEMRRQYAELTPTAGEPDPVASVREILVPTSNRGINVRVRVYHPVVSETPLPIVVFVHGGGHVSGNLETHDVMARALALRANVIVLAVDYHVAPEVQFPVAIYEVLDVLRWADRHADQIGGDRERLVIAGDSAGGALAAAAAIAARDSGAVSIAAQLLCYPSVASTRTSTDSWQTFGPTNFPTLDLMPRVVAAYVPEGINELSPLVAPLNDTRQGRDLPPAGIFVGAEDPLRDDGIEYGRLLTAAGVAAECKVYEDAEHGFMQFFKDVKNHPRGEAAINDAAEFLRRTLNLRTAIEDTSRRT